MMLPKVVCVPCTYRYKFHYSYILNISVRIIPRVVTGEKNMPTATYAARKMRDDGYPVREGIAEPTCPGGYKYGGLAFRFGERQADDLSP